MAKYKHYFKKIMPNVENLDFGHRIFVIFQMLHLYPPPLFSIILLITMLIKNMRTLFNKSICLIGNCPTFQPQKTLLTFY